MSSLSARIWSRFGRHDPQQLTPRAPAAGCFFRRVQNFTELKPALGIHNHTIAAPAGRVVQRPAPRSMRLAAVRVCSTIAL